MSNRVIHTVPVWREADGRLTYGIEPREEPIPEVVGWANVEQIEIAGEMYWLLLTSEQ